MGCTFFLYSVPNYPTETRRSSTKKQKEPYSCQRNNKTPKNNQRQPGKERKERHIVACDGSLRLIPLNVPSCTLTTAFICAETRKVSIAIGLDTPQITPQITLIPPSPRLNSSQSSLPKIGRSSTTPYIFLIFLSLSSPSPPKTPPSSL